MKITFTPIVQACSLSILIFVLSCEEIEEKKENTEPGLAIKEVSMSSAGARLQDELAGAQEVTAARVEDVTFEWLLDDNMSVYSSPYASRAFTIKSQVLYFEGTTNVVYAVPDNGTMNVRWSFYPASAYPAGVSITPNISWAGGAFTTVQYPTTVFSSADITSPFSFTSTDLTRETYVINNRTYYRYSLTNSPSGTLVTNTPSNDLVLSAFHVVVTGGNNSSLAFSYDLTLKGRQYSTSGNWVLGLVSGSTTVKHNQIRTFRASYVDSACPACYPGFSGPGTVTINRTTPLNYYITVSSSLPYTSVSMNADMVNKFVDFQPTQFGIVKFTTGTQNFNVTAKPAGGIGANLTMTVNAY